MQLVSRPDYFQGLAAKRMNVAEAAEIAGYASESAFSRAFKKEVGVAPAAFRHMH